MESDIQDNRAKQIDEILNNLYEEYGTADTNEQRDAIFQRISEFADLEDKTFQQKLDVAKFNHEEEIDQQQIVTDEDTNARDRRATLIQCAISGVAMLVTIIGLAAFEKADGGGIIPTKLLGPALRIFGK